MKTVLVSRTQFIHPEDDCEDWQPEGVEPDAAEALIEFTGRECYQSWSKPRPESATTPGYIKHSILAHRHLSVIEHATCGFRITGIPLSLTHELIRHRHFSYSQLSARYVSRQNAALIDPPVLHDLTGELAESARELMLTMREQAEENYGSITNLLTEAGYGPNSKVVRQAARAAMPVATDTRIVVSGNLRAWRHFINLRATVHADAAIRELALEILHILRAEFPAVFSDYTIRTLGTGETIAEGLYNDID